MEQRVGPIGLRVGIIRDWESRQYADKDCADLLLEDVKIRELLFTERRNMSVFRVKIERSKDRMEIMIRTARPDVVIGISGENVEMLKKEVEKLTGGKDIYLKVLEIASPDLGAELVTRSIADRLEQRTSFRTAQRKAIQRTTRADTKGIKTAVSGRLDGANMTRTEGYNGGVVPLHTLRVDIDYAQEKASTAYGRLGVEVWICRGKVLPGQMVQEPKAPKNSMNDGRHSRRGNRGRNRNSSQRNDDNRNSIDGNAPRKAEGGK